LIAPFRSGLRAAHDTKHLHWADEVTVTILLRVRTAAKA
tara:strand:- start:43 stop:159 length:117 start_codon:yes stop_codon:yes gene_type:complete